MNKARPDVWLNRLRLEPTRKRILRFLLDHYPRVVFDTEFSPLSRSGYMSTNTLKVHISAIRRSMEALDYNPFHIRRSYGKGYYLIPNDGSPHGTRTEATQHP